MPTEYIAGVMWLISCFDLSHCAVVAPGQRTIMEWHGATICVENQGRINAAFSANRLDKLPPPDGDQVFVIMGPGIHPCQDAIF